VGQIVRRTALAVVAATVLAGAGVEAAAAAPIGTIPAAMSEAFGGVSPSHRGGVCILPAQFLDPGHGWGTDGSATAMTYGRPAGNLVVDIPSTVFIRVVGRWLFITTNTGAPPAPQDEFAVIRAGHAYPADPRLRRIVEFACRATRHR
jgi:hypothetical protein